MNLFDIVTPANISAYWDDTKANQSKYMGEMLFPHRKIAGLELNKIGGRAGLPVTLKASSFDTQATYRDRLGIEVTKSKMPFFRERMKIDETTRQQILQISQDAILKNYVARIFDDTNNLIRGARATREKMVMDLISTGHIKIEGNGVKLDYDYNIGKKQKFKSKWSDPTTSTPIQDLIDWVDYFRTEHHVQLGYAVMNTRTFNLIKASESTRKALYPLVAAGNIGAMLITSQQVKDLVSNATGLTILINDSAYASEVGGAGVPFFPDMKVSLLPVGGTLGNMTFGTTPEEIDLLTNSKTSSNTRIVDTGVAVYSRLLDHPVNVEVIVSQICLPSFSTDIEGGSGAIGIVDLE